MDLQPGEEIVFEGHPTWRATPSFAVKALVFVVVAVVAGFLIAEALGAGIAAFVAVDAVILAALAKRNATHYVVTNQRLHIRKGLLSRQVQQTRLDRIQNVTTRQSLGERLLRVGTVEFDTTHEEDGDMTFEGVANPSAIVAAVNRAQHR